MSWPNALRKMTLTMSALYTCSSITRLQTESILIIKERHYTLQSILSRHQSCRAWRSHGVRGSLARGIRDLSSVASRRFPIVLDDTAGATCARISSLDSVRLATADRTMRRSCRALYYAAVQNLAYGCGNIPQTTAESSDIPPMHCAQHLQQSFDMSIQLPAGL